MTRNHPFALAYVVERTLYESSSIWEGIDAQEIHLGIGEVVLRTQPGFAVAMPLRFHQSNVEASLVHAIEQVEAIVPWCLWVIGPSSQPSDLQQRLVALDDLSLPLPSMAGLVIEPLNPDNAEAYATAMASGLESPYRAEWGGLFAQCYDSACFP